MATALYERTREIVRPHRFRDREREKIGADFDAAVDAKIELAKDPSLNAYRELIGVSIGITYLRHPKKDNKEVFLRVVLLDPILGSGVIFQFDRVDGGIKRTIFGGEEHQGIESGMLSTERALLLIGLITNPSVDPIERAREVTHLSETERAILLSKGLTAPEPQA